MSKSKFGELLDDGEEIDVRDSNTYLDPKTFSICSINELREEIKNSFSEEVSKEFMELAIKNKIPLHYKDVLMAFFNQRTDYFSEACYKKLLFFESLVKPNGVE